MGLDVALVLKWLRVTSLTEKHGVSVLLVSLLVVVHTDLVMDLKLNYCHLNYFENIGGRSLVAVGNGAWKGNEIIIYQVKKFQEIMSIPRGTVCPLFNLSFLMLSSLNHAYAVLGTRSRMKKICLWL